MPEPEQKDQSISEKNATSQNEYKTGLSQQDETNEEGLRKGGRRNVETTNLLRAGEGGTGKPKRNEEQE